MAQRKKDSRALNVLLATTVFEQLEQFCEESGLSKTVAVERIMGQFFQNYFDKSVDDRAIFKPVK